MTPVFAHHVSKITIQVTRANLIVKRTITRTPSFEVTNDFIESLSHTGQLDYSRHGELRMNINELEVMAGSFQNPVEKTNMLRDIAKTQRSARRRTKENNLQVDNAFPDLKGVIIYSVY